jgi:HTH-type transcriptional regulator/antitoxin HigA
MITKSTFKAGDSYLKLVQKFPLRAIRSEPAYDAAIEVLIPLTAQDEQLDKGEMEYLQVLAVLVGEYEREHYRIKSKNLAPLELLKFLIGEAGLSINDVGAILGSQSVASMILNGKREISKENAKRLAAHFNLNVGAFIA